jgi:hypothetical protein
MKARPVVFIILEETVNRRHKKAYAMLNFVMHMFFAKLDSEIKSFQKHFVSPKSSRKCEVYLPFGLFPLRSERMQSHYLILQSVITA